MRALLIGLLAVSLIATIAQGGIYQYAVEGTTARGQAMTAYLWVPPEADRIRGVLLGGMATSVEPVMCDDPHIRQVCSEQQLAIVYFSPHVDALFMHDRNPQEPMEKALKDLAETSGYQEIAVAPWFVFGHSVSTVFASKVAAWKPERCFGVLLHKGGIVIPDEEAEDAMRGVPILGMKGQFEEFGPGPHGALRDFETREAAWQAMRDRLVQLRAKDDRYFVSLLVEPGATHFAWHDLMSPYVAKFIGHAAERRIPDWPISAKEPVKCRVLEFDSGALSSSRMGEADTPEAAKPSGYKGKASQAMWHLDLELAKAADAIHAPMNNRRPQFVTFADPRSGKAILPGHDLRLRFSIPWVGPDTFRAAATFLDAPPRKYPEVEGEVGHAATPPKLKVYGGQIEQIDGQTFRVKLDPRRRMEGNLLAYHPGNETYRYAEQAAILKLPKSLDRGKEQTITFAQPASLKVGGEGVKLTATSDSGLEVRYYVASGPAIVEGDMLRIADLPARAKLPMEVKVVAYQWGSAVEPFVQSAEPVTRVVEVTR